MSKKEKEPKQPKQPKQKKKTRFTKDKFRKFMMGTKDDLGFLKKLFAYVILICIGFIFLYPIFKMISVSMMNLDDLLDSSVQWIPKNIQTSNYRIALKALDFWQSLWDSILIAGIPTLIQVVVCAFVGYGFARFNFKLKGPMMGLMIFSFILPVSVTMIPNFVLYSQLGWTGSLKSFIIPALLGQGLKSQIFILICWTFFKQVPQALIEAAQIDGAGYFKSFYRIAIPSAAGALLVVFLFSFVWYWNEEYLTHTFVYGNNDSKTLYHTLVLQLRKFNDNFASAAASTNGSGTSSGNGSTPTTINEAYRMAATLVSMLPLLIMYFVLQRQFVESVDKTGITGE